MIGTLGSELSKRDGTCIGFVVMPDHVHALVWFPRPDELSEFMQVWKQRSSVQIKRALETHFRHYASRIDPAQPVWQAKYYSFNVFSEKKLHEKLDYMHWNPVRAGLVACPTDWP